MGIKSRWMNVFGWGYKIMLYSFKTSTTLKEKDREKWWLENKDFLDWLDGQRLGDYDVI